jgi:hypothetical protein
VDCDGIIIMEVNIRTGHAKLSYARGPDGLGQVLLTRLVGHNLDKSHGVYGGILLRFIQ